MNNPIVTKMYPSVCSISGFLPLVLVLQLIMRRYASRVWTPKPAPRNKTASSYIRQNQMLQTSYLKTSAAPGTSRTAKNELSFVWRFPGLRASASF